MIAPMRAVIVAVFLVGGLAGATFTRGAEQDADADGIRDALEQELAERFRPEFWVNADECAERPAQFQSDSVEPRVLALNGTIYVRVSPSTALGPDRTALTLSYYHLWDQDCGPLSPHPLDVEHVSTLVEAPSLDAAVSEWVALYWYAAAHEDTICDTSNAARADVVRAVTGGPHVWIARGKHASYLSRALCSQRGCGVDTCGEMMVMPPGALVNLGESDALADGVPWVASPQWPLAVKLSSDFDVDLVSRLETSDGAVLARVNGQWRPQHVSLSIGGDVVEALGTAGGGLVEAEESTSNALDRSLAAVGGALSATARALGSILGR